MSVRMYFARAADGSIVDVTQVPRGLKCGCFCLGCGDALNAKQGEVTSWHFAHASVTNARPCGESALHKAAKHLLSELSEIKLPALHHMLQATDAAGREHESVLYGADPKFRFDSIAVEYETANRRLDALLTSAEGALGVEIKVRHAVDEQKAEDLGTCEFAVLEIDLASLIDVPLTREDLKVALATTAPRFIVVRKDLLAASFFDSAKRRLDKKVVRINRWCVFRRS
jgi:hypothetical protein